MGGCISGESVIWLEQDILDVLERLEHAGLASGEELTKFKAEMMAEKIKNEEINGESSDYEE